MTPQKKLEECIEAMRVDVSKHPSGVLVLRAGSETFTIFPLTTAWSYRISRGQSAPHAAGRHPHSEIQSLVHTIQKWVWDYTYKH